MYARSTWAGTVGFAGLTAQGRVATAVQPMAPPLNWKGEVDEVWVAMLAAKNFLVTEGHVSRHSFDPAHSCMGCEALAFIDEGMKAYRERFTAADIKQAWDSALNKEQDADIRNFQ